MIIINNFNCKYVEIIALLVELLHHQGGNLFPPRDIYIYIYFAQGVKNNRCDKNGMCTI